MLGVALQLENGELHMFYGGLILIIAGIGVCVLRCLEVLVSWMERPVL